MGVLNTIQNNALRLLKADPYYARITLLSEQIGDIRNQIDLMLAKLGICAIVLTPKATVQYPGAPGPRNRRERDAAPAVGEALPARAQPARLGLVDDFA